MIDLSAPNDAQSRQQSVDTVTNAPAAPDNENISLLLRPAEFDDELRATASPQVAPIARPGPSTHPLRHRVPGPGRVPLTTKTRELLELAGNPFMPDPHVPRVEGQPAYRQDIYPAYDVASGRRVGFDHVHNTEERPEPEPKGYYRKHVHEYDNNARDTALDAPAPAPAQVPVQSNYPEHGPLPPVSAVLSGLSPDSHFGVGTFSHIQNRPRTPHEVLGLPPGVPLNLWSLRDPTTPDGKPQYNYHVLVKLAILGNKGQKATLQEILRAIRLRFPYYENLQKSEAVAFGNSIRHLLSLLAAFVREPKPVTEPGKGAYWRVDFSKGEGNKRVRKRNKPQKKQGEKQNSPSGSDNSEPNGAACTNISTPTPSKSPVLQSPTETSQDVFRYRTGGKGGRKPAPKNLVSLPDGGTATVPIPVPREDPYSRVDTATMSSAVQGSEQYRSEPYLQLHPSNTGAHRERVTRGMSRSAPYPSTLPIQRSGSASGSASGSDHEHQYSPRSPHYGNRRRTSVSSLRDDSPPPSSYQSRQQGLPGPSNFRGYERGNYHGPSFAPRHSQSNDGHHGSVSPQDSPVSTHPALPSALYSNHNMHSAYSQSRFSSHFAQNSATFPAPTSSAIGYSSSAFATSSNSGSMGSSSVSQGPGFLRYAAQQSRLAEIDTMHRPRGLGRHEGDMYANSSPWQATNSSRAHR